MQLNNGNLLLKNIWIVSELVFSRTFYVLLCGNNRLKQKNVQSSVAYCVHV
jgi:hypothetical protein